MRNLLELRRAYALNEIGSTRRDRNDGRRRRPALAGNLKPVPLVGRECATEDRLDLAHHHPQLRDGVLRVGGDGQAVMLEDEKLVPRAGVGTFEAELSKAPDKISALTGPPPAHESGPG